MRIVMFGAGGHAKVVADIVEREAKNDIAGLVTSRGLPGDFVPGYDVLADNNNFASVIKSHGVGGAIVALGDNRLRKELVAQVGVALGFVTAIHPSAVIGKDVVIGEGTVVMAGAVINPSTRIGRHCIINTKASVDHDCAVGDFAHIGPGCVVAGGARIGEECFLGVGSVVVNQVAIGARTQLGAGAVAVMSLGPDLLAMGLPARPVKSFKDGD